MEVVLEFGGDPNEVFNGHTIWQRLLHSALQTTEYLSRQEMLERHVSDALHLFLTYGADPHIKLGAWSLELTALEIVQAFDRWTQKNGRRPRRQEVRIPDEWGYYLSPSPYPKEPVFTIPKVSPRWVWYTLPPSLYGGDLSTKSVKPSVRVIEGLHELEDNSIYDTSELYRRFMEIKSKSGPCHGWKPIPNWHQPVGAGSGKVITIEGCFELGALRDFSMKAVLPVPAETLPVPALNMHRWAISSSNLLAHNQAVSETSTAENELLSVVNSETLSGRSTPKITFDEILGGVNASSATTPAASSSPNPTKGKWSQKMKGVFR